MFEEQKPWFTPTCYVLCTLKELKAISVSHGCQHVKTTSVGFICHIPFTNACFMFRYACCYLLLLMCFLTKGQQSLSSTLSMCDTHGLCCYCKSSVIMYFGLQYFRHSFISKWIFNCTSVRTSDVKQNYFYVQTSYCVVTFYMASYSWNWNVVGVILVHRGGKVSCSYNVWDSDSDKCKDYGLMVVILHSLVDQYSYTSVLTLWRWR
jgi:hypothetical protein